MVEEKTQSSIADGSGDWEHRRKTTAGRYVGRMHSKAGDMGSLTLVLLQPRKHSPKI